MLHTALITLLESLPGQHPTLITAVLDRATKTLMQIQSSQLRSISMQLVCLCLYINLELSLSFLQSKNMTKHLLQSLVDGGVSPEFSWEHQRISLGLIRMVPVTRVLEPILKETLPALF
jgi:hypothetical protein